MNLGFLDFCEQVLRVEFTPTQKVCFGILYDGREPEQYEGPIGSSHPRCSVLSRHSRPPVAAQPSWRKVRELAVLASRRSASCTLA